MRRINKFETGLAAAFIGTTGLTAALVHEAIKEPSAIEQLEEIKSRVKKTQNKRFRLTPEEFEKLHPVVLNLIRGPIEEFDRINPKEQASVISDLTLANLSPELLEAVNTEYQKLRIANPKTRLFDLADLAYRNAANDRSNVPPFERTEVLKRLGKNELMGKGSNILLIGNNEISHEFSGVRQVFANDLSFNRLKEIGKTALRIKPNDSDSAARVILPIKNFITDKKKLNEHMAVVVSSHGSLIDTAGSFVDKLGNTNNQIRLTNREDESANIKLKGHELIQFFVDRYDQMAPTQLLQRFSEPDTIVLDHCYSGNLLLEIEEWYEKINKDRLAKGLLPMPPIFVLVSSMPNQVSSTGNQIPFGSKLLQNLLGDSDNLKVGSVEYWKDNINDSSIILKVLGYQGKNIQLVNMEQEMILPDGSGKIIMPGVKRFT